MCIRDSHHTNADTFDKIDLNELNHCVATLAVMAYVIADMDAEFPRWYLKQIAKIK